MSKNQNQQNQNPKQNQKQNQKILEQLTESDVEVLYQKRRIERAGGEAEVHDKSTTDLIREVFGDALESRGVRDSSTMSLESLARQFCNDEGAVEESISLESLSQMPDAGGNPDESEVLDADEDEDEDEDEEFSIEMLSPPDVRMGYERSKLIDAMEGRTPEHVENLKQDLADDLGCTVEQLPEYRQFADIVRG